MSEDIRRQLYTKMKEAKVFDGDYSSFTSDIDKPDFRKQLYDQLYNAEVYTGNFEDFDKDLTGDKKRFSVKTNKGTQYFGTKEEGDTWAKQHKNKQNGVANDAGVTPMTEEEQQQMTDAANSVGLVASPIGVDAPTSFAQGFADFNERTKNPIVDTSKFGMGESGALPVPKEADDAAQMLTGTPLNKEESAWDDYGNFVGTKDSRIRRKAEYEQERKNQRERQKYSLAKELAELTAAINDTKELLQTETAANVAAARNGNMPNTSSQSDLAKKLRELNKRYAEIAPEYTSITSDDRNRVMQNIDDIEEQIGKSSKAQNKYISRRQGAYDMYVRGNISKEQWEKEKKNIANEQKNDKGFITDLDQYRSEINYNLGEARKLIEQADRSGNASYVTNLWYGFTDKVLDTRNWDFGAQDLITYYRQRGLLSKFEDKQSGGGGGSSLGVVEVKLKKGEKLSKGEELWLKSIIVKAAAEDLTQHSLGKGYVDGQITAEALPFMLEFYVAGAAGDAVKGAAKGMIRTSVKGSLWRKTMALVRNAERAVGDVEKSLAKSATGRLVNRTARIVGEQISAGAKAAAMSVTTGSGKLAGSTLEKMNGEASYDYDKDGNIIFTGVDPNTRLSASEAFNKSLYESWKENFTEMGGGLVSLAGRTAGKTLGRSLVGTFVKNNVKCRDLYKWLYRAGSSQSVMRMQNFFERTQWHGTFGEYWEEVEGNVMDATVAKMTNGRWGDGKNFKFDANAEGSVFNLEDNIDTFRSLAIMGIVTSGISTGAYLWDRHNSRRSNGANDLNTPTSPLMPKNFISQYFGGAEPNTVITRSADEVRNAFAEDTRATQVLQQIDDLYKDGNYPSNADLLRVCDGLSENELRATLNYVGAKEGALALGLAQHGMGRDADAAVRQAIDEETEEQAQEEKPAEDKRTAAQQLADAQAKVQSFGQALLNQCDQFLESGADFFASDFAQNLSEEEKETCMEYFAAVAAVKSIEQNDTNQADAAVEAEEEALSDVPQDGQGNVTYATIDGKTYYVMEQDGENITLMDGQGNVVQTKEKILDKDGEGNAAYHEMNMDEHLQQVWDEAHEAQQQKSLHEMQHHQNTPSMSDVQKSLQTGEPIIGIVNGTLQSVGVTNIITMRDGRTAIGIAPYKTDRDGNKILDENNISTILYDDFVSENDAYWDNIDQQASTLSEGEEELSAEDVPPFENEEENVEEVDDTVGSENEPIEEDAESNITTDEEGEPDFTDATEEDIVSWFSNQGDDIASPFIDAYIGEAKAQVEKLNRKKPDPKKYGTKIAKYKNDLAAWQQQIDEAQSSLDRWKNVKAKYQTKRADDAISERSRKSNAERLEKLDIESMSWRDYVLAQIASGQYKFKATGNGRTRGIAEHTTGRKSIGKDIPLFMLDNTNGMYPEVLAQHIWENMPQFMYEQITDQDVFEEILDIINTYRNYTEMVDALEQRYQEYSEEWDEQEAIEDMENQEAAAQLDMEELSQIDFNKIEEQYADEYAERQSAQMDAEPRQVEGTETDEVGTDNAEGNDSTDNVLGEKVSDNDMGGDRTDEEPDTGNSEDSTVLSDDAGERTDARQNEKSSSDNVETDNYTIAKQHHDKADKDIWIVRSKDRADKDTFTANKKKAKENNGYYSSFKGVNGFVFDTPEDAEAFAKDVWGETDELSESNEAIYDRLDALSTEELVNLAEQKEKNAKNDEELFDDYEYTSILNILEGRDDAEAKRWMDTLPEVNALNRHKKEKESFGKDVQEAIDAVDNAYKDWIKSPVGDTNFNKLQKAQDALRKLFISKDDKAVSDILNRKDISGIVRETLQKELDERAKRKVQNELFDNGIKNQGEIAGEPDKKPVSSNAFTDAKSGILYYHGQYHDPQGYGVVTNGTMLYADKRQYDESKKGKVVLTHKMGDKPKGTVVDTTPYPKWKELTDEAPTAIATTDVKGFLSFVAGVVIDIKERYNAMAESYKDSVSKPVPYSQYEENSIIAVRLPNGEVRGFSANRIIQFAKALQQLGAKEVLYGNGNLLCLEAKSDNGVVMIMPRSLYDYGTDSLAPAFNENDNTATAYYYDAMPKESQGTKVDVKQTETTNADNKQTETSKAENSASQEQDKEILFKDENGNYVQRETTTKDGAFEIYSIHYTNGKVRYQVPYTADKHISDFKDGSYSMFGDTIYDTLEEAKKGVEEGRMRVQRESEAKEELRKREEEKTKHEAEEKERKRYDGFTDGMTPMQVGQVAKVLDKVHNFSGKIKSLYNHIKDWVNDGRTFSMEYFNNSPRATYICMLEDGTHYEIPKIAYDFAKFLGAKVDSEEEQNEKKEKAELYRLSEKYDYPSYDKILRLLNNAERQAKTFNDNKYKEASVELARLKDLYKKYKNNDNTQNTSESEDKEQEAEPKPVNTTTSTTPKEKIGDVGEKIGGARKDLAQSMADRITLTADTFPKMFPKFDFIKLIEQGLNPKLAATVMWARQMAMHEYKKSKRYYTNERALKEASFFASFAKQVLEKGDTDVNFTDGRFVFTDYGKNVIKLNVELYSRIHDVLGNEMFGLDLSDYEIIPISENSHSTFFRKNAEGKDEEFKPSNCAKAGTSSRYFETTKEAIDYVTQRLQDSVSYKKAHPYNIYVYEFTSKGKRTYFVGAKIGNKIEHLSEDFERSSNAREYLNNNEAELQLQAARIDQQRKDEKKGTDKGSGEKRWKPQLSLGGLRQRVGEDYRQGRDIGAEEFRDTFGFRGVEFGNYVTQKERQQFLNESYDALMDLAKLLNVSPRALSLDGQLGFAVGARGIGNANAHYEPNKNVINLTKKSGAGAVAHEWWHALDYFFNRDDNGTRTKAATSINDTDRFNSGVRNEMRKAFLHLMDVIKNGDYFKRSRALERKLHPNNWGEGYYDKPTELGARAFQDYVQRRLIERGNVNDFLSSFTTEEDWNGQPENYPYPKGEDATQISEAFDNLFGTMQQRTDEATGNVILYHKADNSTPNSEQDTMLRDALADIMQSAGIDVITDSKEGQKTLDAINEAVKPHKVFHGSGADFDAFDHSHMGEGEDAQITDKERFFRTSDGEVYGFVKGGKIYLDPRIAGSETAVHEYTHLWAEAVRKNNPELWNEIRYIFENDKDVAPLWDKVKKDYPELNGDELLEEVIANYSGKKGSERLNEAAMRVLNENGGKLDADTIAKAINDVRTALNRFWDAVKDFFGIENRKAEDVADMALRDLLNGVKPDAKSENIRMLWVGTKGAAREDASEGNTDRIDNLNVAKKMERAKADVKAIKFATGWERGTDGKWRYEESGVNWNEETLKGILLNKRVGEVTEDEDGKYNAPLLMSDVIDDDNLFAAYPFLRKVPFYNFTEDKTLAGAFSHSFAHRSIAVNMVDAIEASEQIKKQEEKIKSLEKSAKGEFTETQRKNMVALGITPEQSVESAKKGVEEARKVIATQKALLDGFVKDFKGVLNHEVQHYIQYAEGWTTGGSSSTIRKRLTDLLTEKGESKDEAERLINVHRTIVHTRYGLERALQLFKNPKRFLKMQERFTVPLGSNKQLIQMGQEMAKDGYFEAMDNVPFYVSKYGIDPQNFGLDFEDAYALIERMYEDGMTPLDIAKRGIYANELMKFYDAVVKASAKDASGSVEIVNEYKKLEDEIKNSSDKELYTRLAGEVEARNASRRMDYTNEQRKKFTAQGTEDVSRKKQLVLDDESASFGESNSIRLSKTQDNPFVTNRKAKELVNMFRTWTLEEMGETVENYVFNHPTIKEALGNREASDIYDYLTTLNEKEYKRLTSGRFYYPVPSYDDFLSMDKEEAIDEVDEFKELVIDNFINDRMTDVDWVKENMPELVNSVRFDEDATPTGEAHKALGVDEEAGIDTGSAYIDEDALENANNDVRFSIASANQRGYTEDENGKLLSDRAYYAKEDGRYPKMEFRKAYQLTGKSFDVLNTLGIIGVSEWHHTGLHFNKTDFFAWADDSSDVKRASHFDVDNAYYADGVEPNSLANKYLTNKTEIDKLAKEYDNASWEYKDINYVPKYETFAHNYAVDNTRLTEQEQSVKEMLHANISENRSGLSSSERYEMHKKIDERYFRILQERIQKYVEEHAEELRQKYNEEYGEKIKENNELDDINSKTNGKEQKLIQICRLLGLDEEQIHSNINFFSHRNREKEKEEQEAIERRRKRAEIDAEKQRLQNEFDKWIVKGIKDGKIIEVTRVRDNELPELFDETKAEMNGRYGWFEARPYRYNLPIYKSGYAFASKATYNAYTKRKAEIYNLKLESYRFHAKEESDAPIIWVSPEEYAKISHQIETYPNKKFRGLVFTANNFYLCDVKGAGDFRVLMEMPIEGNEDLIDYIHKNYGKNNSRIVESNADIDGRLQDARLSSRSRVSNNSSVEREQYSNSRLGGVDTSSEANGRRGDAKTVRTLEGQSEANNAAMTEAANSAAEQLRTPVIVINSEEELDALAELSDREKKAFKRNANGMYSIGSGKVYVYLPNCTDADEVKRIVLHEVVGHKGLRQLLGEQGFHDFCFKLYSSLPKSVRDVINRNALTKYSDIYEAMDEYLADEAEKDKAPTWWQKAAAMLRQFIRERLNIDIPLSINDAKYILWQSKNQLQQGNIISEAQHISMRRKLGINQKNDSKPTPPNGGGGGYRNHTRSLPSGNNNTSPTTVSARDHYNRSLEQAKFYISEAFQDSMQGLKNLMDSIMQAAGKTYEDVKTWENPYLFENHMSSINEAEFQMFTQSFAKPLMETIKKLTNGDWKQAYDDLKLYMMAKHGLERNVVFAERDARKEIDYDKRKEELDDRLHKPNITQAEAQQILVEAQQLQDELNDAILAKREKDYSGISAMFADKVQGVLPQGQTPTLEDYEAAARQYCRDYDSNHDQQDINDLWVQTKQCNMAIIGKQREGGLITAETELALNSMFQYYVPLRGFDETLSDEVYDYLNNDMRPSSSVIKKAKGRTSIANDPIATMANMAENSIVTANRNKMKRMLLYFAQNHPSDVMSVTNLYFANVGPNQWEVVAPQFDENDDIDTINRKREQFEQDMEQRVANDPTNYAKGTQPINMDYRTLDNQLGEHQVIVVDNGKQYVITINGNPRAAQAINGLTNPDNGGSVQRKFAAATRWLSMVNTTLAPEFVISNFGRDTYFANTMVWVKESPRYAMNYNRNWWISLWNIRGLTKRYEQGTLDMNKDIDRLFLEFVKNGGRTGFTAIYNVEKHKELIQEALRLHNGGISTYPGMAWDFIKHMVSFANEVIENTARFTAYMTSRQMGRPQIQAAHDAKEISVNFNKKGAGYKSLSRKNDGQPHIVQNAAAIMAGIARQSFVFFNAGVQGMQNFSSAARKHPYKFTAMSMLQLALGGIIVPLLNSIGGDDDDDDYFDLSDFERRQNICIRIGKGKFVKIPLPIELRAIYGLGDIVYGQLTGKNRVPKEALAHDVMSQFMQIVPFDPVTSPSGIMEFVPTVARPIVEIVANKDWTGKPIYKNGEWDKGKAEWERAYKFTNPLLVDASRALTELTGKNAYDADAWAGFNPAIAEHTLKGYLGGAFSFANKTAGTASDIINGEDLDARRIPFVNRLYADVDDRQFQTKYVQGYFNLKDRVEKFNHQKKSLEDDLGTYANDPVEYAKVLSQYNKLIVSNDALIADLYKQAEKERKIYKNYEKKGFNVDEDLNILYKNTVKQQRKIDELE